MKFINGNICTLLMCLSAGTGQAGGVTPLDWGDLLPEGQALAMPFSGIVDHSQIGAQPNMPPEGVRHDFDGQDVSLSGFVVPLDYVDGNKLRSFILVPYVGACIHVPPPPANQLVLVSTAQPFEAGGMFEPVTVTGMFGAASNATQIADIGYALSADKITPYTQ